MLRPPVKFNVCDWLYSQSHCLQQDDYFITFMVLRVPSV